MIKHGGKRKGAGRKKLPASVKRVKVAITLSPVNFKKTSKNRSAVIETALNQYFGSKISSLPEYSC